MKLTKEELKELYQRGTARTTRKQADCPTEEALLRAITGHLSRIERKRLADHLITCSDCIQEYQSIQSLAPWAEQAAIRAGEPIPKTKINGRAGRWTASVRAVCEQIVWQPRLRAAAAAFTTVVVIGAAIGVWRVMQPGHEAVGSERGAVSLTMKIEPPNQATLREPPAELIWSESRSVESYRVVLYDFESTPIWESSPVKGTSIPLPQAIRNSLQRSRPIYWRVIAQDGVDRRQSEMFQFTISP